MFVLLFLMVFLDVQRPVIAVDGMEKQFVVSELVEQSLTGCAENLQGGGGFNGDPLTVDWLKSPEPTEGNINSAWFPTGVSATENASALPMSMRVVPVDPPNPDPNTGDPGVPPVAATPEPSTVAILGITAVTLLFLLFGQRMSRRFLRRI